VTGYTPLSSAYMFWAVPSMGCCFAMVARPSVLGVTCGRPLGTDAPALMVNEMDEWALAELHHRGCRAAEWNDGAVIEIPAGNMITWRTESALFPLSSASGEPARCAMLS
jgi:hypothetical protein